MNLFRTTIISLALMVIIAWEANAQNRSWGIKGGVNLGTPYMKPEEGSSGSLGLGPRVGAFIRLKFKEKLYFQIEALYSVKGGNYRTPVSGDTLYEQVLLGDTFYIPTWYEGWVEGEFGNRYIDFPLQARYQFSPHFSVLLGPQISYLIRGLNKGTADMQIGENYSTVNDEPFDISDKINKWDYSILLGASYESHSRLNFDLGLSFGLRSIFEEGYTEMDGIVRNIYLNGTIGYRISKAESDNSPDSPPDDLIEVVD
ncbi:MAG: porin family protein [Bacteroidales bacterium]|nr:PorT family protein [Lentimicrobiaceae bacterium]MDD5694172.1 porin family protein [Bacteroidales bacterium]